MNSIFFKYTKSYLTCFIIFLYLSGSVSAAVLEAEATNNGVSWQDGGVYNSINIKGATNPVFNVSNKFMSVTGEGPGQQLVNGVNSTAFRVNGVRLALGSATNSQGGILAGSIELLNQGSLIVYGNNTANSPMYSLTAQSPYNGQIYGNGSLHLLYHANLQAVSIGTQTRAINNINLGNGSQLTAINGINSKAMHIVSAGATAINGNILINNLQSEDGAIITSKRGNIEINGPILLKSGVTSFEAGSDITINTGSQNPSPNIGAGAFSAKSGRNLSLINVNGNFTAINAGADALLEGSILSGQSFNSANLILDSSKEPVKLSAENIKTGAIATKGNNNISLTGSDIEATGAITGNENFFINASGAVKAKSIKAGSMQAGSINITSGGLSLLSDHASVITGNVQIHGNSAQSDSGSFKNLTVGGTLSIAGSSLSGDVLNAGNIVAGSNGITNLSTIYLQAAGITANGLTNVEATDFNSGLNIAIGKNSQVSLGQPYSAWLVNVCEDKIEQGCNVLGLYKPAEFASIIVNPADSFAHEVENTFYFAPNSVLAVNAEMAKNDSTGMITAANPVTAHIANGAKLILSGVRVNSDYKILGNNITVAYAGDSAWEGTNLETTSHLISARKIEGRDGWFTTEQISAAEIYPSLSPGLRPPLDSGIEVGSLGTENQHINSTYAGVRFLSRVGSTNYMDHDYEGAVITLESAVRMAILGGVPQMTYAVNNAAEEAALDRAMFEGNLQLISREEKSKNFALWIKPLYRSLNTEKWEANNYNYDLYGNIGGIISGADWTLNNILRLGLSASLGGGYSKSGCDLAKTVNDMGFAGIGAYAGLNINNLSLGINTHYTGSWNSLKQDIPQRLKMSGITGDLTGRAFSVAMKALYKIPMPENWNLIPYAGASYTYLLTDNYTLYSNGALLDGEKIEQSIWSFPSGLKVENSLKTDAGWNVTSRLDFGIIPAAGNLYSKTHVRFTGTPGAGEVESQIMDYTVFSGGAGVEFSHNDFSFGLSGNIKIGSHGEQTSLLGTLRYEF